MTNNSGGAASDAQVCSGAVVDTPKGAHRVPATNHLRLVAGETQETHGGFFGASSARWRQD